MHPGSTIGHGPSTPSAGITNVILLVDDDRRMIRLLELTLRSDHDYNLLHASTGAEALRLAHQFHPRLVLLDMRIPDESGAEVCASLKADQATAGAQVYIVTAYDSPQVRDAALAAGADGFIAKPFNPVTLLNIVQQIMEGRP